MILLGLLCILSLESIRSRFYEAFYQVHILIAISYFGLLFWHAENQLDSWNYLYATLAVWLASWLARTFWYTQPLSVRNSWFEGSPAKLFPRPDNMTEIEILAPQGFKWSPMQHCFLRVPKLAWLGNHPFTMCSSYTAPTADQKSRGVEEYQQTLVFLTRTHSGFTKQLAEYAATHPDNSLPIWLEGPYGGLDRRIELAYDHLILIAGGGGITAILPWISMLAQKIKDGSLSSVRVRRISVLWTVKQSKHLDWASQALKENLTVLSSVMNINVSFVVTHEDSEKDTTQLQVAGHAKLSEANADDKITILTDTQEGAAEAASTKHDVLEYPDISTFGTIDHGRRSISEYLGGLKLDGRNFVIGCGPAGLRSDVANACASLQKRVLQSEAQEIAMHLEEFG